MQSLHIAHNGEGAFVHIKATRAQSVLHRNTAAVLGIDESAQRAVHRQITVTEN